MTYTYYIYFQIKIAVYADNHKQYDFAIFLYNEAANVIYIYI